MLQQYYIYIFIQPNKTINNFVRLLINVSHRIPFLIIFISLVEGIRILQNIFHDKTWSIIRSFRAKYVWSGAYTRHETFLTGDKQLWWVWWVNMSLLEMETADGRVPTLWLQCCCFTSPLLSRIIYEGTLETKKERYKHVALRKNIYIYTRSLPPVCQSNISWIYIYIYKR